jgi:hypothetical protein
MRNDHSSLKQRVRRGQAWLRLKIAPRWRLPVGIALILAGSLGFLPVLGFWMIPLGIAVASLGLRPVRKKWRDWNARH